MCDGRIAGLLRRPDESKADHRQRVMQNQAAFLAADKPKAAGSHTVIDYGNGGTAGRRGRVTGEGT